MLRRRQTRRRRRRKRRRKRRRRRRRKKADILVLSTLGATQFFVLCALQFRTKLREASRYLSGALRDRSAPGAGMHPCGVVVAMRG